MGFFIETMLVRSLYIAFFSDKFSSKESRKIIRNQRENLGTLPGKSGEIKRFPEI